MANPIRPTKNEKALQMLMEDVVVLSKHPDSDSCRVVDVELPPEPDGTRRRGVVMYGSNAAAKRMRELMLGCAPLKTIGMRPPTAEEVDWFLSSHPALEARQPKRKPEG
jgi:hypothetical protein